MTATELYVATTPTRFYGFIASHQPQTAQQKITAILQPPTSNLQPHPAEDNHPQQKRPFNQGIPIHTTVVGLELQNTKQKGQEEGF